MRNLIICIVLCAINANLYSYAMPLELTDVIKQAREIEMKKQLAVKNMVREIKDIQKAQETAQSAVPKEQPATKYISPELAEKQ